MPMIFCSGNKISLIIMWQSQSYANPCALIGSFLVSHRRFCQPTYRKAQTQKRRRLLIWTLFSVTWKLMVWKTSLNTFFPIFFFSARRKNGEGCEPATVSSVQPSIQRYLTYSRTMSSKNPEKSVQRSQIPLFTSTAKETWQTASCSSRHRQRGCPFWSRRIRRPQSSCASKNYVMVFIP